MINNYELKDGVLYIYLDFNYEFGSFTDFGKNLRKEINNIIKNISANKIKIIVNGLVISTLLIAPLKINDEIINNIIYIKDLNIKEDNEIIEKLNSISNIILDDVIVDNSSTNTINNSSNTIDISSPSSEKTNNVTATNKVIIKNNTDATTEISNSTVEQINNDETETVTDNSTYVTVNRSNGTILNIELETYLIGVVASEMPASFNIEALKAQAVVARTYTLKRISEGKILTDTVSTQVYKDDNELKNMWGANFNTYYNKIKNAVTSTTDMYITYNGYYIDAVYHSTSNGYTEDAVNVWDNDIPYLKSIESIWDKSASSYERTVTFTLNDFNNKLGIDINKNSNIDIIRNESNRVSLISIDNNTFDGIIFRSKLGLRSTDFNITINEDNVVITTYGYGHGVGMSQYGANGMSNSGYSYKDIINHYYRNVKIED